LFESKKGWKLYISQARNYNQMIQNSRRKFLKNAAALPLGLSLGNIPIPGKEDEYDAYTSVPFLLAELRKALY
jgi:hypothetical protein